MSDDVTDLLALTRALGRCARLEEVLQLVADRCASLLATPRVSIRLFDPTQTRLIATCRAGQPLHLNATSEYQRGEGLIGWIAQEEKTLRADDAEADPRFTRRPDMVEKMGSFLGAPLMVQGACIGVVSAVNAKRAHFTARHEELLELIADMCSPHLEVARLSRLAQLDALTGAFNRRGLELVLPETLTQLASLVMVDIDHFKLINDQLGHSAGDEVLKRLARLLSAALRDEDAVIRMGGEEFLLVLPDIDVHQAMRIAERIRATVEEAVVRVGDKEVRLTVSAGVAQKRSDEPRDTAVARADAALYEAKQSGRNRVRLG